MRHSELHVWSYTGLQGFDKIYGPITWRKFSLNIIIVFKNEIEYRDMNHFYVELVYNFWIKINLDIFAKHKVRNIS